MKTTPSHPTVSPLVSCLLTFCASGLFAVPGAWASTVSYDTDSDGLIEISNLAQLNAVRWDLDGDGAVDSEKNRVAYETAFPNAATGMGCATHDHDGHSATPDVPVCTGYELAADLDFDTDGDGDVDAADQYWHSGAGWVPIGSSGTGDEFIATFDGNDYTISRLYIRRSSSRIGLFGVVGNGGQVRNLGIREVSVTGSSRAIIIGGLAGLNRGSITGSHVTGSVKSTTEGGSSGRVGGLVGSNSRGTLVATYSTATVTSSDSDGMVGGLAGYNHGRIWASYAIGSVTGTAAGWNAQVGGFVGRHNGGGIVACYATGSVTGKRHVGGFVGGNIGGVITASYATGDVTGDNHVGYVGGLVGDNAGGIFASYATGWVTGKGSNAGGLIGRFFNGGVRDSYWNTTTTGKVSSDGGEGKTTAELQSPVGYTGIYSAWNRDLDNADGDRDATTGGDDPWDFGTAHQYPALRADFDGDGTATWQEFGEQRGVASTSTDDATHATLTRLGVSPVDIADFAPDVFSYHIGVAYEVSEVNVTPYMSNVGATIDINGSAVSSGSAHPVALEVGRNVVTVTGTAQDGIAERVYTVTADRGSNAPFGWKVTNDFNDLELHAQNNIAGIWSDGSTIWVACFDGSEGLPTKLCSYDMSTKERKSDFHTLGTHGNNHPQDITSDGTTMWVVDNAKDRVFAYRMSNYSRNTAREIDLARLGMTVPLGITVLGNRLWVMNALGFERRIYAFRLDTLQRYILPDTFLDRTPGDFDRLSAAGNDHPAGIWTDGKTMWVADIRDGKIYAYKMTTKERDAPKDFDTLRAAGNAAPIGIWSDGETMWVADYADEKIYSYNMPSSGAPTHAPTDFNGDGRTDFADFFLFADAYGGTDPRFDLDGNGRVDFADFFKFVDGFGS